ncbi:MATE efflux family protein [[Clostridium] bifermentans ATCC 638]|uniref:Multidrug export protein MepA n=1 Tax=Paraclostridium bifermentans ATCC 638 = DSM 14991 TaxID=1233171 RepID=T4V9Z5_PARBF|nr:MATE family efflux transporter [Paraclostridium bifermentans]EQK40529.1 MATE efflux family protein [[Clostridium] bifermentans ATCC 638] [Paraclostridium bifermentans ATCC 638 = DSM 14991]RIZ58713.1 MATE family efflux transporter [Paraclostridium bifermentans]UAG18155.1 MATE family efflux transporter [Paraclostridium bifermentans]
MEDKKIRLLRDEKVPKAILKLSIPMVMGMMIQVLYNLVDTYFIGMLNDANQLAAANISLPVFMMLMAIAGIVGSGSSSYISRCLGNKDYEEANKTISIATGILVIMSIIVMIAGIFMSPNIAKGLGANDATFNYTYKYIVIMFIGAIPVMCSYALGQLLRSEGNIMQSVIGLTLGTVVNIVLDPVFIFGLKMEITGAAIATIIGQTSTLLYFTYAFLKGKTTLKINLKKFKYDKNIFKEIFTIGVPASLNQMLMGVATVIVNNIAVGYGTLTVAGMGVAMKIMTIGTFVFMGFSAGCQPLVGYNYGCNNITRVKEIIKKGIIITSIIGLSLALIFGVFANSLIGLFTSEPEVINKGTIILRALIISLPFVGGQMISTTSAQSMGKVVVAFILSISRQGLLYMPLLIILNKVFGFSGFIYAQPITDMIMLTFSSILLFKVMPKENNSYELKEVI